MDSALSVVYQGSVGALNRSNYMPLDLWFLFWVLMFQHAATDHTPGPGVPVKVTGGSPAVGRLLLKI